MADLAVWQRTIVDEEGNVIPGAEIEVRREEDDSLATLYADRAGETPLANPLAADMSGFVRFFAQGDAYTITAVGAGSTRTWRFDPTGRLQEFDRVSEALVADGAADLLSARANLGTFSTVADVQNSHIPPVLENIRTNGYYTPGDGGGGLYVAGSQGTGAIQSADGRWWELAEPIASVHHFGAAGDGVTDDTAAFQAAIDFLPAEGGEIRLHKTNYRVDGPLDDKDKYILWNGEGRVNGVLYRDLPGLTRFFAPSNRRYVHHEVAKSPTPFVSWDYSRTAAYEGGTQGVTNTMRVHTTVEETVGRDDVTVSEWAFQARVDSYSPNAHVVAVTGQARRYGEGPVWAGHFNCIDEFDAEQSNRAVWGIEANISTLGPDPNNRRRVIGVLTNNRPYSYNGPGVDVTGYAMEIHPETADFNEGIFFRDSPTRGRILNSAIKMYLQQADVLNTESQNTTTLRFLSRASDTIFERHVRGVNENQAGRRYFRERVRISNNEADVETGTYTLSIMGVGEERDFLLVNGGLDNPIRLRVDNKLKQVTQGGPDSGGSGYRLLRVPND